GRAAHRHRERFRHRRAPPVDLDQLGPLDPSEAIRRLRPDGTTGRLQRPRLDHRPSSLPLERTDDRPRPKSGGPEGPRARSVPYLSRGSRGLDRKSTRLNSSHLVISYAVFCLKKKKKKKNITSNTNFYVR